MKNSPKFIASLFLLLWLPFERLCSQNNTYELNKTIQIPQTLLLLNNSDFGIKSTATTRIYVRVYNKFLYDIEDFEKTDALIYSFKSTGNTGTGYENTSFDIEKKQTFLNRFGFGNYKYKNNGYVSYSSNSLEAFRRAVRDNQHYIYKSSPYSLGFYQIGDGTIDIVVQVSMEEGGKLSEILGIKIPGLSSEIVGSDFIKFNPKTFAFLGNYGCANQQGAKDVANFIKNSIKPDLIISAGNDSYHSLSSGGCGTSYADNATILYKDWLAADNRFASVLGSMDYSDGTKHIGLGGEALWKTFFNQTDVNRTIAYGDNIDFFMINTNSRYADPDPKNATDLAATKEWLTKALAASKKQYKIVVGHHSPQGSGQTSSNIYDWNFQSMGADMYISSGGNFYERLDLNGIPHVNVGLGGYSRDIKDYSSTYPSTLVKGTHYSAEFGSLKATVFQNNIRFEFMTVSGKKLDEFYLFGWESSNYANNYYLEKFRGTPIQTDSENLDIYLILGQSNASGRCGWLCFREFVNEYSGELDNTYLLNEKNEFEHAKNSIARYSTVEKFVFNSGLGVPWSFAQKLNESGKKIGFISNARGGVETEQWFPDYKLQVDAAGKVLPKDDYGTTTIGYKQGNNLYQEALFRYNEMKKKYPNAMLKGVVWMQGESDALNINVNNYDYTKRTTELISHFRSDYGLPTLQFLLTEAAYKPNIKGDWEHTKLNEQIREVAKQNSNVFVATVEDLYTFDQIEVHWQLDSYKTLGERLAALVLLNESKSNKTVLQPKNNNTAKTFFSANVVIYPNPSKDGNFYMELKMREAGNASIEIVDLKGKSISLSQKKQLGRGNHKLQISKSDVNLASGLYLVKVATTEFNETHKLLVE